VEDIESRLRSMNLKVKADCPSCLLAFTVTTSSSTGRTLKCGIHEFWVSPTGEQFQGNNPHPVQVGIYRADAGWQMERD
jgi:hypothetical protein